MPVFWIRIHFDPFHFSHQVPFHETDPDCKKSYKIMQNFLKSSKITRIYIFFKNIKFLFIVSSDLNIKKGL